MHLLNAETLRGSWPTVLLPIDADDGIDFARLSEELDALVAVRPSGLYSGGTAGEFYTLHDDEFERVNEMMAESCEPAGIPFQIGATHTSAQAARERIRRTVALRPSAFQVILPDWFPVSNAEAADCLKRFAEAADGIGLVLYNPPHAKRVLSPVDIGSLSLAVPSLIGVKVGSGDAGWYSAMREQAGRLALFVPGHHLATGMRLGAHGSYSNVACLSPGGAQRWYETMKSDLPRALEVERRIQSFFARHITPLISEQGYANAAVDKLLAAIGNWSTVGTRLRWPYRWIEESVAESLRPIARRQIPELFRAAT